MMNRRMMFAVSLIGLMAPASALAQAQTDTMIPTIPESQIEAANYSSPFEFLSAATSIDEFEIKTSAYADTLAESPDVKTLAAHMATEHAAMMKALIEAGKADKIEIAQPSPDGEQQGMLTKLEGLRGADFDKAYIESQLYVHQRAIAAYKGYAEKTDSLGKLAASGLPKIVEHYDMVLAMAKEFNVGQSSDGTVAKPQTEAPKT